MGATNHLLSGMIPQVVMNLWWIKINILVARTQVSFGRLVGENATGTTSRWWLQPMSKNLCQIMKVKLNWNIFPSQGEHKHKLWTFETPQARSSWVSCFISAFWRNNRPHQKIPFTLTELPKKASLLVDWRILLPPVLRIHSDKPYFLEKTTPFVLYLIYQQVFMEGLCFVLSLLNSPSYVHRVAWRVPFRWSKKCTGIIPNGVAHRLDLPCRTRISTSFIAIHFGLITLIFSSLLYERPVLFFHRLFPRSLNVNGYICRLK